MGNFMGLFKAIFENGEGLPVLRSIESSETLKRKRRNFNSSLPSKRSKTEFRIEEQDEWPCSKCSFLNSSYLDECEICGHKLDETDLEAMRQKNYLELLSATNEPLILNRQAFECPICMTEVQPNGGLQLRGCLHLFCRDCLISTIQGSENVDIQCPFIFEDLQRCSCLIDQREIKAILSSEDFTKYLQLSLNIAERQIQNSFHCKKPNCPGWWEIDVSSTQNDSGRGHLVKCPVCQTENCYNCRATHEGKTCMEYQKEELQIASTYAAKRTKKQFDKMLKDGTAMHCPQCNVILTKMSGCDLMRCSMCQTFICWATKGYRYGPEGCGGCTYRKKCHPDCSGCH